MISSKSIFYRSIKIEQPLNNELLRGIGKSRGGPPHPGTCLLLLHMIFCRSIKNQMSLKYWYLVQNKNSWMALDVFLFCSSSTMGRCGCLSLICKESLSDIIFFLDLLEFRPHKRLRQCLSETAMYQLIWNLFISTFF